MAKNKLEDNKPKVVYNSDGSATVKGAKSWAEAAKAVKSSVNQSRERADAVRAGTAYKNAVLKWSGNTGTTPAQEAKKTAVDKLWDRQSTPRQRTEQDEARSDIVAAKRNTEQKQKELEDYQNTDYDWTDAAARELYEKGEKQKKQEIAKAQAEQNAAVANFDRVQMNAMSEEDRALIDEYIRREDTASDPLATGTDAIVEHFVNQNGAIDEERLKQLVSTRRRELNAQRMQETQEKAQKEANDGWMSAIWANLKTVPANLISGAMGTMSDIHDYFNRDERYSSLDPNSMGNQLNVYSGAVRGQTAQNIVGTEEARAAQIEKLVASGYGRSEAEFIVNKGRQGLAALYQAGMSAADTGARAAVGGVLGLGAGAGATIAGLNTFSQTMSDASARGATPEQALMLAVTTAGIEAATEKVPLDNLIQVSKGGGAKSLIKNIMRQAGIEATEEELSLIGTALADAAIMQEKSEYNQTVAEYMAQGMTEEQAREQANWGLVQEAVETAIVSGIAGGIGGFGAAKVAAFGQDGLDTTTRQAAQQPQTEQNPQDVNVDVQQEAAVQTVQEAQKTQTPKEQGNIDRDVQDTLNPNQKVTDDSTVINTDPSTHTPQEQAIINDYQNSVDENLVEYIQSIKDNPGQKMPRYPLKDVSERAAKEIKSITGVDVSGNKTQIEPRMIEHILKDHGENGMADHSMRDVNDIARIQYVIDNYDSMEHGGTSSAYVYQNSYGRNANAQTVLIKKKVNGTYFVVEAVPDTKKKTVYIVSAYMSKNGTQKPTVALSGDANAPRITPENATKNTADSVGATAPDSIVNRNGIEVNQNSDNTEILNSAQQVDTQEVSVQDGQEIPDGMKGTGAAEQNFSGKAAYQDLLTDENAQRDRSTGVRPVEVPKVDANGNRVTEFAGNVYSAKVTPDSTSNAVESLIQDGKLGFDTRTNQQSLENARQAILDNGPDTVLREIASNAENNVIKDGDVEKAMVLYAAYANDPEMQDEASGLIADMSKIANMSGRNLQLFSLMQRMTPEGQLMAVEKNISRCIEDINKGRPAWKKVDVSGTNQQAREAATAVEKAREDTGKAIDRASKKVTYRKGKVTIEGNQAGEPFAFEYAQKVGEELAKGLERSIQPQKEKTFLQTIAGELKKFASEKIPQREKKKPLTATDVLRDYIQNQEFYNQAWEAAQQTIRDGGEIDPALDEFVNSGIGVDANNNPKNKLFAKALANAAMESGETAQMLKRQEALGFSNMSETIASRLISETGATGEMAQTIRDAAKSYVNEQLSADKSNAGKQAKSSEEIVQSSIRSAMQDIKATFSKVAISDAEAKQTVKERIVDKLVKKYGFWQADAGRVADIVGEQYEAMVKAQAEKILKQKFAKKGDKAQKSTEQIFRELANLGAFNVESNYSREATAKVLGDKFDAVISQELADQFLKAKTDEEKQAVMDAIYKDVASNIKPTLGEAWDAWRNLSMLGNALTHERNIGSTAAWQPFVEVKRDIGAAIEAVALRKKRDQRTKAILGFSENDRALLKWAGADAKTQSTQKLMEGSGRTGNEAANEIQKYRKLLPGPIDKLSKGNMDLMGAEDSIFKSHEYSRSLASFLKARGYTAKQLQNGEVPVGVLDQARQHAVQEAKKATFNDQNEFSKQFSNMLGPKANNPAILNIIKKANTPYLRTPANIVHRAYEYSPLSLGKTLITAKSDIDSGRMSASDVIDRVSSGLTGTAAMGLGAALSAGIIPGVRLIAEPTEEEKMEGAVPYSLEIGGKYYPAGWLAPAMIPLFIGARLNENLRRAKGEDGGINGWDVVQAVADSFAHSLDPILDLSVLSSLKSVLEEVGSYGNFSDKAVSLVVGSAMEYLAQGIPVLFGQLEKAFEPEKKSVYVNTDRSIEKTVKKTIGNATKRIPGIDLYQTTKLDDAGNPVTAEGDALNRAIDALFNPITVSEKSIDPVIKEMARLNKTPDIDVKPKTVPKTVSYQDKNGNIHTDARLTEEQYQKWSAAQKKAGYRITHELVSGTDFKNLTDLQKAKALELAQEYATDQGKRAALDDYPDQSGWMAGIDGKEADTILKKVAKDTLNSAISSFTNAIKNGWSTDPDKLEAAYKQYSVMSDAAKKEVQENAEAEAKAFLEVREQGVSAKSYVAAVKRIALEKPQEGFTNVRPAQKYTAIANAPGVDNAIIDKLMKAYMDDYDPNAKNKDTTELKYDYIRQEMGYSPAKYAKAYDIYSYENSMKGKGMVNRMKKRFREELGVSAQEANLLYRLYHGDYKPWNKK